MMDGWRGFVHFERRNMNIEELEILLERLEKAKLKLREATALVRGHQHLGDPVNLGGDIIDVVDNLEPHIEDLRNRRDRHRIACEEMKV
jgi:hypothetical protein